MLTEILSIIIWPLTIFLISIIFMLSFKKSIDQVINRLQKTKLPGGAEAEFGSGEVLLQATAEKYLGEEKELTSNSSTRMLGISTQLNAEQAKQNIEPNDDEQNWFYFFMQHNYKKARELLLVEIEQQQDLQQVQFLRSTAASMLSYYDFNGAIEEYESLINKYPTNYAIYSSYSWIYINNNLPDDAIAIIDRAISKIKDSEYLLLRKAQILEQYQRYDEALAIANTEIKPQGQYNSKFYCLIARIQEATNQENEARTAYIKGFKSNPSDLEVIREIANYFFQLNNYQMEFFFRKQAIIFNNKDASDHALLGNCYLSLGLNGLAMHAYEEANKLAEGKQAWIIANIGNLLNNVGLHTKAIDELSKSLEMDPSSQYAHERLSRAMADKDKEDQKAKEILESSRKIVEA